MQQAKTSSLKQASYEKKIRKASGFLSKGNARKASSLINELMQATDTEPATIVKIAKLLIRTGNAQLAQNYLSSATAKYPESNALLLLLASVYRSHGLLDQAVDIYRRVLERDSTSIEAGHEYGIILSMRGYHDEAILRFNTCIDRIHDTTTASDKTMRETLIKCYNNLGLSLTSTGRFDEALTAYQQSMSLDKRNMLTITGLANLHEKQGDKEAALDTILLLNEDCLSQTGPAMVYARLATHHHDYDKAVSRLEKAATRTSDINEKYAIYLQAGKTLEAAKQYDRAFRYYTKGNDVFPDNYDRSREEGRFNALKQAFTVPPVTKADTADERAVFILGMPRSGTSLVEQILASHREIAAGGEQDYFHRLADTLNNTQPQGYPGCIPALSQQQIDDMARDYSRYIDNKTDNKRFTDKLPHNFLNIGLINLVAPHAYIIHCTRDPLDICLSCYANEFSGVHSYSHKLDNLAHYYGLYVDLIEHWKTTLDMKWLDCSYEALVANSNAGISELIEFLELEWDESCLTFYENTRAISTASYDQANKKIYSSSVQRWKRFEKQLSGLRQALPVS